MGQQDETPTATLIGHVAATDEQQPVQQQAGQMVNVVAPSTLPGGYTFEAQIGDRKFMAMVPPGGVKEGETFLSPLPAETAEPGINIPEGHWKDGLCDCFNLGCCHAHLCCAIWCTQIAMGQVMQRLKLTWLGHTGPDAQTKNTFKVVLTLVIAYSVFSTAMDYLSPSYVYGEAEEQPSAIRAVKSVVGFLMSVWSIYALMKTRQYVRERYNIPEERCHGCEDLCCAFWCSTCSVAQIARHTGEYETYRGQLCSETGLPAYAPAIV